MSPQVKKVKQELFMDKPVYAIYIRVSTDKQADNGDSIPMQENLGKKIIEDNNGILFKIYAEPAVSASKTRLKDRTILLECLNDAKAGLFNKLIVYRRDRLARKIEDSLAIRGMLEQANCELIYSATGEMQSSLNDPYGKMMENIRASLDEIESAQISMRVTDVMQDKAKRGEAVGGNLPFGYIRNNKKVLVVPDEVKIINEIEDLYLSGYGVYSIVKWLNGNKVQNLGLRPGGAVKKRKQTKKSIDKWTEDVVQTILFNAFYTGVIQYSKDGDRKLLKGDDLKDKVIVEKGEHEAIRTDVKQKMIYKLRDERKEKIKAPRHYTTSFLLSGILYCSKCGSKFATRNSTRSNGKQYLYYLCSSNHNHTFDGCGGTTFKKEILEEYIINKLKIYLSKIDFSELSGDVLRQLNDKDEQYENDLKEIEKKLDRYTKDYTAIRRLLLELDEDDLNYDLLKQGYQDDQVEILKKLNNAKLLKSSLLENIEVQSEKETTTDYILEQLKDFSKSIDIAPFYLKKSLIDGIIDKIVIDADGNVQTYFKFDLDLLQNTKKETEDIEVSFMSLPVVLDKTTVVLAPLVASAGVPVAKMSGRGLGHTGGTLDKLESISGFSVEMGREQFFAQVGEIGAAVIGQSGNITPADKKLYALRDVTATVESIPLIASSVMSKKIAAGADAIVLDVKTGSGAFMKTLDDSIALAQAMVDIGTHLGRNTVAVISDMDQPLGFGIGNALEVKEGIETLKGHGPKDLQEVCLILGSQMLVLGGKAKDEAEARTILMSHIEDGSAYDKFKQMVAAQGGDVTQVEAPDTLPSASRFTQVKAASAGYVESIQAEEIGVAAMLLGAGRETKESLIDLGVGIQLSLKVGDAVAAGDTVAVLHVNDASESKVQEAEAKVLEAYRISAQPVPPQPLVFALVTKDGVTRY
ncbi:thymidine phosphorylase [Paenibacillus tianjinensis]|uniref:Pyrimidine-nucleoside phosphorylase n=1 Tax=Paenibacillus tianjinensis TaxID=2810347 RepID=A0ABX7LA84_9BACL|nr:thymidine phosphorylase [Paenibacillus tianjinensis]